MLDRKIYQMYKEGCDVSVFLRDQQRWIEDAQIIAIEGDIVSIRYEMEEDYENSSWEEFVRLESIGAISRKLASVPRGHSEILVSDDCPEAEQIYPRHQED
ncbi:MAG: hypothetical protein GW795_07575 [Cyanobacteria bacterium]|nr:hypothetical protein [Cyanobacteria bacterium CG_2015-16_32_12]NCO77510.1 hypothetical protein [Cyanobacteria bacterium CG_2015-22_32_23]NCQ04190.1 hypothetical protein [Cyanobacteria bacterium CG_2015-09_32_10]NCQ41739.1 hypothetical protein [Cyanobacteria bacterium CG_2015-04_32_10]NCS84202.1 hypothetical protein [Cyanobacteria bacterium CG_2015-02_32_10]